MRYILVVLRYSSVNILTIRNFVKYSGTSYCCIYNTNLSQLGLVWFVSQQIALIIRTSSKGFQLGNAANQQTTRNREIAGNVYVNKATDRWKPVPWGEMRVLADQQKGLLREHERAQSKGI